MWRNRSAQARVAEHAARADEVGLAQRQHGRAHDAHEDRDVADADRERAVEDAGPERRDDREREQDRGDREDDVARAQDRRRRDPAEVAGHDPAERADAAGDQRGDDRDLERDADALEDEREHVAPELVGAEEMVEADALERWRSGPATAACAA